MILSFCFQAHYLGHGLWLVFGNPKWRIYSLKFYPAADLPNFLLEGYTWGKWMKWSTTISAYSEPTMDIYKCKNLKLILLVGD